jgi:asparagine synthase (glutamine-hydrolysing)
MSGIFGIFNQDGAPVRAGDLNAMASLLARRGPDGTGIWNGASVGLGHTLLATTPELVFERQPWRHAGSGCTITADVRLDNRPELLSALGLSDRAGITGDAELIVAAYLAWGEDCLDRLLGDFAFAIWDPRRHRLFCARDQFGMRPLYYHHSPGRFLAFASEPRALLALPQVPYRINEGRIADFLVSQLEGIDKTSTFFEEVFRLPPAHALSVTPEGVRQWRYWALEPGPELRLATDQDYAEAFLEVFTEAVRCRLRSPGPVGSMLSGGMDSGSVTAIARGILAETGQGPLATFSAVGPDPETCVETRTIHAALSMGGLDPHLVSCADLDPLMPELELLTWQLDDPFDSSMTLIRAIYLAAHAQGLKVLLDGVAGDTVLSEGPHISRLLRAGHWWTALRETAGQRLFWGNGYSVWSSLGRSARTAFTPSLLRQWVKQHPLHDRRRVQKNLRHSLIHPDFADRVDLAKRLRILDTQGDHTGLLASHARERAAAIEHPYLTVGRERYDRVASAVAVEPRDPFLDRRVVAFCLSIPAGQKLQQGWPKAILRRAMAGKLPDAVRWRRGKQHLGWNFTKALMARMQDRMQIDIKATRNMLISAVKPEMVAQLTCLDSRDGNAEGAESLYEAVHLAIWLDRHSRDLP